MKVGVIGVGNWGKNIVKSLANLGVLAAVADTVEKNLNWAADNFPNIQRYETSDALLCDANLDAVVIATSPDKHYVIAVAAMEEGLDVFVEKPLTLDPSEARMLSDTAANIGCILMVGHLLIYQPAIQFIKNYLEDGKLGKVFTLTQRRSKLGRVRSVENVLWSFGVHDIAVLLHLVGETPADVLFSGHAAFTNKIEDDTYLHLKFPSGIVANLHNSWYWPRIERELIITGEKGILVFDELNTRVILHKKRVNNDLSHIDEGEDVVFVGTDQPLLTELKHFLDCCEKRQQPVSNGLNGFTVVNVLSQASPIINFL
jgi:predicted dehydrogenase